MKEIKEKIQETLKREFGFAPSKKEISIKRSEEEIEFYVNGYWYKIDKYENLIR